MTAPLCEADWVRLHQCCVRAQVSLRMRVAPVVAIPELIAEDRVLHLTPIATQTFVMDQPLSNTLYLQSSDRDLSVHLLKDKYRHACVVDISEVSVGELIETIEGHFKIARRQPFQFFNRSGVLPELLTNEKFGRTVFLSGTPTKETQQYLTHYLLTRVRSKSPKGTLVLIDEQSCPYYGIDCRQHQLTVEDYNQHLADPLSQRPTEGLSLIEARRRHRQLSLQLRGKDPHATMQDPWAGLHYLPTLRWQADTDASNFEQTRLQQVNAVLAVSPYVVLTGMSGVGKTRFVEKVLSRQGALYQEDNIKSWAENCKGDHDKYLFIDEAAFKEGMAKFEGLFHSPPSIVISNRRYPLTEHHKVVFATNPCSFGGNRQVPPLFSRHGCSVVFGPIPLSYLREQIIRPQLLQALAFDDDDDTADDPADVLIKVAVFLYQISVDEILITPRELAMMATLAIECYEANDDVSLQQAMAYFAYQLALPLVPASHRTKFTQKFACEHPAPPLDQRLMDDILINQSNAPAAYTQRDWKCEC